MTYSIVDSILKTWAKRRSVPLLTEYRDEAVRAFEVLGKHGNVQFQIWIDPPDTAGKTTVHAWDRKQWRVEYNTTVFDLASALDRTLDDIAKYDHSDTR